MAIKILEVDLYDGLKDIPVEPGYEFYRILVRICRQPVGWIKIPASADNLISVNKLNAAIANQISWHIIHKSFSLLFQHRHTNPHPSAPISLVVCTRNRSVQLANCLQSLLAIDYPNYEIIIVDNAPDNDETYKLATSMNVRYVCEKRPGLDWARNRGIQEASHDIVAFTDDDVNVDRYWLQAINKAFSNPQVMAVTGYVAPAELETDAQIIFELSYGGMGHGFYRRVVNKKLISHTQLIRASNFGIGANMSFRRNIFSKIGVFDTALDVGTPSSGGGDIEMLHRLVAMGHTLIYEPAALVWHTHRRNLEALKKQILFNGISYGCYLITCIRNRTAKRSTVIKFFLFDWFYKWALRNLLRSKIPKSFAAMEIYGMMKSPRAYKKSQSHAKKLAV